MKRQIISLILALATGIAAMAVPARRGFVQVTGPDGTPIAVQLVGDEYGHYFTDADGKIMMRQANNTYDYVSEEEAARKKAMRRVPEVIGTFPGSSFPAKGKQKAIVILVEYQDQKFELGDHAHDYFTNMLNQDGFNEYGGTGSVHEYFMDSSNGQFDCQFDLFGPVTLSRNLAYYGGNDINGNDKHPEEMVIEACQQLNDEVNFTEYDRDNDGIIDNVYVIYAGRGEASDITGEYQNTVWPHSWDVSHLNLTFDGKLLATYGCSNEWEDIWVPNYFTGYYEKDGENPDGIGTFIHEFSHVLGLPDLYNTQSSSSATPGEWSVLDYGPYNNNGRTPPAYSAFERNALGWISLTELTAESGNITLPELNSSNQAYCITNTNNPDEFFLIESRARTGWDKYLPGKGMLIWHVDYNSATWASNAVNNNDNHLGVDLIEADGIANKAARDAADAFPGSKNVKTYTPKWWNRTATGFYLNNIVLGANNSVNFDVISTGGNTGGDSKPYLTVSDVQGANMDGSDATVRGYLVGYANNGFSAKGVTFTANGCTVSTNVVLSDNRDEDVYLNCIPVQLSQGEVRNTANIKDNPENLGKLVEFDGILASYFGVPGLKSTSAFRIIEEEQDAITEIEEVNNSSPIIYDLSGRRVLNPTRPGLYIINGKKVLL